MEGLDKKDKQIILDMFSQQSRRLNEVEISGPSRNIREAAKKDNEQLHITWGKFEKLSSNEKND